MAVSTFRSGRLPLFHHPQLPNKAAAAAAACTRKKLNGRSNPNTFLFAQYSHPQTQQHDRFSSRLQSNYHSLPFLFNCPFLFYTVLLRTILLLFLHPLWPFQVPPIFQLLLRFPCYCFEIGIYFLLLASILPCSLIYEFPLLLDDSFVCIPLSGSTENLPKLVEDIVQTSISTGPQGVLRLAQGIQAFVGVGGEWLADVSRVFSSSFFYFHKLTYLHHTSFFFSFQSYSCAWVILTFCISSNRD